MAFALFLLYVVFTFLRPVDLFAPDLAHLRPMLWLWLLAFLSAALTALSRREIAAPPVYLGLLLAFTVAIGLSLVVNGWAGGAMLAVGEFSTSALLLVLACMNITSLRRLQLTLTTVVLSMLLVAALAANAFHTGYRAEDLVLRQGTGDEADLLSADFNGVPADDSSGLFLWRVRGLGILNDPNDLGQAIVMVLPLLLLGWQQRRLIRNLLFIAAPTALLLYTLYLTHSRGAILGVAAMMLMGLRRVIGTFKTGLLAAFGGIGVLAVGFGGGREFSTQEASAGQRIDAWYDGLQMFRGQPLLGVGYGNFTNFHDLTAHNSFVLCFAELGAIGLLLWVALLLIPFRELGQVSERSGRGSREAAIAEALRTAMVGFMACAWFLSRTYQPLLYLLLALCISAAWSARRAAANGPDGPWPAVPWVAATVGAAFASVLMVYAFIVIERSTG
jgi:putative inorganic carbon (HCO3(-)) transporter